MIHSICRLSIGAIAGAPPMRGPGVTSAFHEEETWKRRGACAARTLKGTWRTIHSFHMVFLTYYTPRSKKCFFALCLIVLCNTMCSSDAVVEPPSPLFRNTVAIVVAGALGPPILPVIAVIATAVPLFSQTVANYLAAVVPPYSPCYCSCF